MTSIEDSTNQPVILATHEVNPNSMKMLKGGAVGIMAVMFMAASGSAPITAMTGNVPIIVGYGNGIYAPGAYVVAGVILIIYTIGYAAMSRHVTSTGSFYGYISHGLGQGAGIVAGLLGTLAYIVFEGSLIGIFSSFARTTIANFGGPTIHWVWFALFGIAAIAMMGYFDVEISGRVLGVALVTEVSILFILGFSVLFHGGGPQGMQLASLNPIKALTTAVPSGGGVVGSTGIGLFFAFWSWVGYETVAVYGEESRDPKRIVPRALMIVVSGIMAIYVFMSWVAVAGNGPTKAIALARSSNPFSLYFNITQKFVGVWAKDIYEVLIITGSFACALAFHNAASRYMYALGREAPSAKIRNFLGSTHNKHKSPHVASLVQSGITLVLVMAFFWLQHPSTTAPDVAYDYVYGLLAILGTMIILILQAMMSAAVFSYFHIKKQHPETASVWRTIVAPFVGAFGMLYVVYLLFKNLNFAAGAAAGSPFFKAIPWIVLAFAVIGALYALVLWKKNPKAYAQMGRTVLVEAHERD
jgi:amino acid transporter